MQVCACECAHVSVCMQVCACECVHIDRCVHVSVCRQMSAHSSSQLIKVLSVGTPDGQFLFNI